MACSGWALGGLQTINRCPQTVVQDGMGTGITAGANDRFCLNGKRLVLVSGTYGGNGAEYRTELDEFSRVISYTSVTARGPDSFKATSKNPPFQSTDATQRVAWPSRAFYFSENAMLSEKYQALSIISRHDSVFFVGLQAMFALKRGDSRLF